MVPIPWSFSQGFRTVDDSATSWARVHERRATIALKDTLVVLAPTQPPIFIHWTGAAMMLQA